ncbi:hypothetical protein [Deinococcus peraridilitoris]|uniref:DUF1440 domain-containing protein n=1 Tax=Deinococcus peraridilitoris (strain DSM 19664 / LMG 22246 / CIP 109416 / KR-200) TaxID=937777 RepID=K9ZYG5_DEIPD|nr:hypothetical protein [Deinococcus peraridilitoris]AFZ66244.1 hypothetical protein Deipe_0657 [Deinococcus peraridilitoris DSM 19664]
MNTQNLKAGVVGGLAGGVVFGVMMATMGMLPMIASLVGSESAAVGLLVHLLISAVIGLGFALVLGERVRGTGSAAGLGALYGLAWWVLGPLLMMPVMMGMGPQFASALSMPNLMSLLGHLIFGVVLGVTYAAMAGRTVPRTRLTS